MSRALSDYDFDLPEELIAAHPSASRDGCRLLMLDRSCGTVGHGVFKDIPKQFRSGDVLVLNDSRVLRSRIRAVKSTGGAVEVLLLRSIGATAWQALIRGKNVRTGTGIILPGNITAAVTAEDGISRTLELAQPLPDDYLSIHGSLPLPPYIVKKRIDAGEPGTSAADDTDYQNVYASNDGSAAAPTAGLHFTEALLTEIAALGVSIVRLTLHTGYGTFAPMSEMDITRHPMHAEEFFIPDATAASICTAKREGRRIIACGTTAARVLESEYDPAANIFRRHTGDTAIFIYPPYRFSCVDALITNFHTPRSTLLALVSAFAGHERIRAAYRTAVSMRYRFFSYGDAMFIY